MSARKKTLLTRIGSVFATLLFLGAVALVVLTVGFTMQSRSSNDAFLFGYKPAVVLTGSMSPYIKQDSIVIIRKGDFTQVEPGDVITYRSGDALVTHRVVEANGAQARVKGDANRHPDTQLVTGRNFVGTEAWRMNWIAPVITGFRVDPLVATLRYVLFPLAAIVLLWFIIEMLARFVRAGNDDPGTGAEKR
ncbi:MAG: signal peptidase I [Actinomycetia bacterium]|nr:signal peptidase I [Actinomycetes bacterium]